VENPGYVVIWVILNRPVLRKQAPLVAGLLSGHHHRLNDIGRIRVIMAQLIQKQFMPTPPFDERMIEGLIELQEQHGVHAPVRRLYSNLIDPTLNEDLPLYAIMEDEDLLYWPQYLADATVDLGSHRSVEHAIARCQEHYDSMTH
jgi:hypothetical protein